MQYEDALKVLEEMRSRYDSGFSSSDRTIITELYLSVCGKRVRNTGCGDCYRDAFIETLVKLKRTGTMPKTPNYILKAGSVIHPHGTSNFYTLGNISDEVAENWLGQYPSDISKFETYPTDWASRAEARKNGTAVEPTIEELKAEVERLNEVIDEKDAEIEKLKAEVAKPNTAAETDTTAATDETAAGTADAEATTKKGRKKAVDAE